MKQLIPLVIFSFFSFYVFTQELIFRGARSLAIGNSSVTLIDEWSFFNNPGSLSYLDNAVIGINYSNQYALIEFQQQDASVVVPLKKGVFSSAFSSSSFNAMSNQRLGFGYSMLLNENISLGVQFNYFQRRFLQLGNLREKALTTDIGVLYKVNPTWNVGICLNDLLGFFTGEENRISSVRLGTDISLSDKVNLLLEGYQSTFYSFQLRTGIEYEPIPSLFFRLGYQSNPNAISFGLGYNRSSFKLAIASSFHFVLGLSPTISLSYAFGENK